MDGCSEKEEVKKWLVKTPTTMEVENFSKVLNIGKVLNYPAPIAIGAGFFCFW
jgi:hypothetical protein